VTLVGGAPTIQRLLNGVWEAARLEPTYGPYPDPSEMQGTVFSASKILLFISHSSADRALAKHLLNLVEAILTVPAGTIRCTSVNGYKLEPGADGPEELRQDLRSAKVVLGLLTEDSLASSFVLMELGAAWGLGARIVPLTACVTFRAIPEPIGTGVHAVDVSDGPGIADLMESIAQRCGMERRANDARHHAAVQEFVTEASKLKQAAPVRPRAEPAMNVEELHRAIAFLLDYLQHLEALGDVNVSLNRATRANLRGAAPSEELEKLRALRNEHAAYVEEHLLAALDFVERATQSKPSWSGPNFRAGLVEGAMAEVRATIGRFREWQQAYLR
jgi:hypothetical protein